MPFHVFSFICFGGGGEGVGGWPTKNFWKRCSPRALFKII